jgi:hypothetical protein
VQEKVYTVTQYYAHATRNTSMNQQAYVLFARAFAHSNPAQVRAVLRDLRASKLHVRSATFEPVLAYFAGSKDKNGFLGVLAEMKEMGVKLEIGALRYQMSLYVSLVCILLLKWIYLIYLIYLFIFVIRGMLQRLKTCYS